MFYEGDLQSGIGLAVQQSKAVLCFVHGRLPARPNVADSNSDQTTQKRVPSGRLS